MRVSPPSRLDCGILLVSCSVLLVELLLTRIFSVTMFYHLSFMVVSLAMLGFGASGLLVNLFPQRFREENLAAQLVVSCIFFAVTTVAAIGASFLLPVSLETTAENWMRVGAVYALCAIPFVAGGLVVSLILTHHAKQANRLYFFDLLGAALGCLAFIPATNVLGAPTAVLAAAALAASAGVVLGRGVGRLRLAALGTAAVLVVLAIVNTREGFYDVRFIKGSRQPPTLAMKWNSFSRVDVVGTKEELWNPKPPVFAGFSAKLDPEYAVAEVWLRYDADANTQITRFTGDPSTLTHLQYDVSSTAYQMRTYHDVLIIGPGGGRDILTALHMGSGPVTGVEINPITLSLLRTRFKTFSGGLYNDYPGRPHGQRRGPELLAARLSALRSHPGVARRHVGSFRGWRLCPHREQSLHGRSVRRLPSAPDAGRGRLLHALVLAAARGVAPGREPRDGRAERSRRERPRRACLRHPHQSRGRAHGVARIHPREAFGVHGCGGREAPCLGARARVHRRIRAGHLERACDRLRPTARHGQRGVHRLLSLRRHAGLRRSPRSSSTACRSCDGLGES
jgi:hypothetical protein